MSKVTSFCSPKLQVRDGSIAGKGVFANAEIEKDEIVWIRSGHVVRTEEAARLDTEVGDFSVQIQDDFFLCPRTTADIADFVIHFNHSCDPNVGLHGEITFVAMRKIKSGEELYVDYAMIVAHEFRLDCACKSSRCRQIVTGEDWKVPELRQRYGKYFSHFIQTKQQKLVAIGKLREEIEENSTDKIIK